MKRKDPWVSAMTDKIMLCRHKLEPRQEWVVIAAKDGCVTRIKKRDVITIIDEVQDWKPHKKIKL